MSQYKVVGNTTPSHKFAIGTIVEYVGAGLTSTTSVFDDKGLLQVLSKRDVEPLESENVTQHQAAVLLAEYVQAAEEALASAEALADEHGLEFSFSPAYGMGGTYYGTGHEELKWAEEGWNPSSMSC